MIEFLDSDRSIFGFGGISHLQTNISNPFNINLVIPPLNKGNVNEKYNETPFSFLNTKNQQTSNHQMVLENASFTSM